MTLKIGRIPGILDFSIGGPTIECPLNGSLECVKIYGNMGHLNVGPPISEWILLKSE